VQWSRDSLGLARALLECAAPFPALVLLTVRDEALADAPVESTLISRLLATDRAREIDLRPLSGAEQLDLVRAMLGLDISLAQQVRRRTAGNPLFAVQLVGDWVERGMLEAGPRGFGLRGGEAALVELPDDIHDMWRRRLDRLVARFDRDAAMRSLELAAALGVDIDGAEWDLACELSGWKVPEGIVEAMVERRMADRTDRGWCFAHAMLRESVERTARRAGRWPAHHRACCRALRHMARGEASGVAERLARHLLAAGDRAEALEPLLVAADRHQRCGDYERALVLCELREMALTELEAPLGDERWAEGWLLMARCAYTLADLDMAEAQLDRVEAQRLSPKPDPLRAASRRVRAQVTRMRGDMRRALALAGQAGEEFKALGDLRSASDCDVIMARLHLESTGDHRTGLALAAAARARFSELGAHDGLAECAYITGHLELNVGEYAEAEASAVEAHRLYELVGDRFGMAACANFRGEIARTRGAFEDAERHYHAAIAILESIGSKATLVPRLNLALVLVQRGGDAFAEAVPLLLDLYEIGRAGKSAVLCYVHYALMACYAFRGEWDLWEEQQARAREHRPETGRTDQDLAAMAHLAGDHAARAGQVERARQAWLLALEHWRALDRPERVAELCRLLGE
jgi:tetratricopeptide (TPR) repeat protein